MAVNDGISGRVKDPFPGVSAGAPNLAPGTPGASGAAADDAPAEVTPPAGEWWDREPASTGGTVEPGQSEPTAISTGPGDDYVSQGPHPDRTDHFQRYPWQQGRQ